MLNVVSIRQKVAKAIAKAPTEVDVKRYVKQDDGVGGYILATEPVSVTTCVGLLNNSGQLKEAVSTGGLVSIASGGTFTTIYEDGIQFKKGDFFITKGKKYTVLQAVNILELNIYWELKLEEEDVT